ncbi:MAG: hypothetical protein ACI80I_002891 [Akkermansiaceae bacterium]|jgi:hypothetical protein
MIHEMRIYDLAVGKAAAYIELFRSVGVVAVTRHLPMAGYWLAESGPLNRLYHLWIYESLSERDACRAGLANDDAWTSGFVPLGFPLITRQQNLLLSLTHSSDGFDQVIKARKQPHPAQPNGPMYAPGFMSLAFGIRLGDDLGNRPVARWMVLSGAQPKDELALFDTAGLETPSAARDHVVLRPLSVSPLR